MNTPSAVSTGLGCLLLCTGVLAVTPGCADSEPFPETDDPGATQGPVPGPVALPNGGHVIDEYVLQVRPRSHTTKLIHLNPGVSSRPGFNPQSVDPINVVQDDKPGSGPPGSVELDTNQASIKYGITCPSGLATSFCGDVTLRSFYTRSLNNVFVQVTSITGTNGNDLSTTHNALNSDTAPSWMTGSSAMGLWKYTGSGVTNVGVLASVSNSPSNAGLRTWEFKDPDGADTNILMRVVASLNYKDYTRTGPTAATWMNPCTKPTNDGTPTGDVTLAIPFGFTFYNTQNTTVATYNRDGVVTLAGATPPSSMNWNATNTADIFKSTTLPENSASISTSPGIYVFWDELNFNASATSLCHGTIGTAPNRQFTFAWRNMKGFSTGANKTNLDFAVILSEGSDTIDMVYGKMNAPSGGAEVTKLPTAPSTITNMDRAQGKKAVIGVQGPSGGVNISTPASAAAGDTVIPVSATDTNIAYRYTPVP